MSKEEPAWRAELREAVGEAVITASCAGECGLSEDDCAVEHPIRVAAWAFNKVSDIEAPVNWIAAVVDTALVPLIKAAEQRGFQAGVNKTGDSVGRLRAELKTARDDARREAWGTLQAAVDRCSRRDPVAAWHVVRDIIGLIYPDES